MNPYLDTLETLIDSAARLGESESPHLIRTQCRIADLAYRVAIEASRGFVHLTDAEKEACK